MDFDLRHRVDPQRCVGIVVALVHLAARQGDLFGLNRTDIKADAALYLGAALIRIDGKPAV